MAASSKFYKNNPKDQVWWVETPDQVGLFLFSFDKKQIFNLYEDYPYKLTKEQIEIFDKENPEWAKYFEDRKAP